jgi:hydrogenase nickel incorporation protein HypA/HybF
MHEQGLFNDMMHKVREVADSQQADRVTRITVRLGALANISPDHFREHFDIARADSIAAEAELEILQMQDPEHPDAQHMILDSIEVE